MRGLGLYSYQRKSLALVDVVACASHASTSGSKQQPPVEQPPVECEAELLANVFAVVMAHVCVCVVVMSVCIRLRRRQRLESGGVMMAGRSRKRGSCSARADDSFLSARVGVYYSIV